MTGHLLRIRLVQSSYLSQLLFRAFQGEPTMERQLEKLTRGATRAGFNTTLLSSIMVPVPPQKEQIELLSRIEQLDGKMELFRSASNLESELNQLNQSILAKAFRGELVPQDPNDEPASVLLERIKAEREKGDLKRLKKCRKRKVIS
jgi:type I restriction enzyme, S subunit